MNTIAAINPMDADNTPPASDKSNLSLSPPYHQCRSDINIFVETNEEESDRFF